MSSTEINPGTGLFYDAARMGPQTHVLVIGVGGYRYLEGGEAFDRSTMRDRLRFKGLHQLGSPPRSALAFANWVKASDSERWKAPPGTIDLLVSPAPDTPELGVGLRRASLINIRNAFIEWYRRCDTNSENVAIFYFCGHGLQGDEQLLLAEDFGMPDDEWQAFAFETTRLAFKGCRAETQCFFVDACREVTTATLEVPINAVRPLRAPNRRDPIYCRYDLTILASAYNARAFGEAQEASYFCKALLRALKGDAAVAADDGTWVVETSAIAGKTYLLLQLENKPGHEHQRPDITVSEPTALLQMTDPPRVMFTLDCDPSAAVAVANLSWERLPNGPRQPRHPKGPLPWEVELEAAIYQVEASFDDASYRDARDAVVVLPPRKSCKLWVGL